VFFATRRAHESLVGADKVTRYTTAIDYFDGECNVSYEYVRRLAAEVSEVGKLLLIDAPPKPPKKKKAAEAGYEEVEKYGKVAETIAGVTVNPTVEAAFEALEAATPLFNALTAEVPALRSVDAIYDAIVAFSLEAARSLPTYDKLELSSRLSEHFASDLTIQDSHSHTITVTPVEVEA
jgi:thioesterase domain-containing protein